MHLLRFELTPESAYVYHSLGLHIVSQLLSRRVQLTVFPIFLGLHQLIEITCSCSHLSVIEDDASHVKRLYHLRILCFLQNFAGS